MISLTAGFAIPVIAIPTTVDARASIMKNQASPILRTCAPRSRNACVVDGDTIWMSGQKIRIADIDTPEIAEPKCAFELPLEKQATDRSLALINGCPFEIHTSPTRDEERYGRKLRVLVRDGRSLGGVLVSKGLPGHGAVEARHGAEK